MQYGKFGTDQAERDFRTWTAQHGLDAYWAKIKQHLEEKKKMKQLFWVAVLYHKGKKTELIVEPEIMLAADAEKAKAGIINIIPSSYKERFDRLEVVVRPF